MSSFDAPADLRDFLAILRREGELHEVHAPVDPRLELAEIHRRVIAADGPALWFRSVKGSPFSVVTNLFGTLKRVELAFGRAPEQVIKSLVSFIEREMPPKPSALWRNRALVQNLLRVGTRNATRAPVLAHRMDPVDLGMLPATTSWPEDGGPFFTWPLVYTQHPTTHVPNLGIYRMHIFDRSTTGMHWQIGKGGGFHHLEAEQAGQPLPVSVFLGGPPAALLGALTPLPENVPELLIASLALGRKLPMTKAPGIPHPGLADAEFWIHGEVTPNLRRPEGPFGDHYGYYSLTHDFPEFNVTSIHHRTEAILPATVVGKPCQEDFYLGEYLQHLLRPIFPVVMPNVLDLWSYGETGFHALAGAVVRERYRREAMSAAFRILGEGQLALTKFLLVVDRPMDLTDFRSVFEFVLERFRPETDLFLLPNLSMDTLDYAGPKLNQGSKGVLLGLGDAVRPLPRIVPTGLDGVRRAFVYCGGCLVVELDAGGDRAASRARIAADDKLAEWPLVVIVDEAARAAASDRNFLWTVFTRFDPAADITSAEPRVVANHVTHALPLVLDARLHEGFPDELFVDDETRRRVDRRWNELFPGGQEMGDSDRGHLDEPLS